MATPVYSTSFLRSHGGAGGIYTVPAGYLAVIRCITAVNTGPDLPEHGQVFLGHSSCTIWSAVLSPFLPSSPGNSATINLRVVVESTDTIQVNNGPDVDVTVSGYLLSLP